MKKKRKSSRERKENMPFNLDRNIIKDSFRGRSPIEKPWYVWYSFDMFINLADELAEARFTLLELRKYIHTCKAERYLGKCSGKRHTKKMAGMERVLEAGPG